MSIENAQEIRIFFGEKTEDFFNVKKRQQKVFTHTIPFYRNRVTVGGASPSGKALVFGISIRRFDPCRPSHTVSPEK